MAIDASIYGQIRQPQQPDLIGMAGQFAQLQGAQQQNRLAQIKMDEYERGVQNQNRLRTLLAEGADAQGLVKAGFLKEGQDWAKNQAEVTDKGADTAKKRLDVVTGKITQYRDYLSNVNDPQTAAQWLQAQYQDPDVGPIMSKFAPIDQAVQRIPQEPGAFQQWKQQQALGATKFVEMNKPTITTRNLGGTTDTLATEGLTGVTRTLNSAKNTQSPDNAASVAATMRGQNMADARAREANANALTKPFEITGEDGKPVLVQQDKQGNIRPVQGYTPKQGASKPLTEGQSKALLFGSRMQEANSIFAELEAKGVTTSIPGSRAGMGVGMAINALQPAELQRLDQAKRDFINATLRRESGAVIAEPEFDNAEKQYFPQPGDSPAVIAQKRKNREVATRGILAEVPDGEARVSKVRESVDAATTPNGGPKPGTVQDGYRFKGGNPADRNSWEKV